MSINNKTNMTSEIRSDVSFPRGQKLSVSVDICLVAFTDQKKYSSSELIFPKYSTYGWRITYLQHII